ncbi:MAG TPA: Maf family protein [Gemmatimonadaceae bacterium]|nr:Maf family protein [Gemmatimonadaceae bacterium]
MLPLVLASASPRRAQLLRDAGIPFEVAAADVDESQHPGEEAEAYVRRVAAAKAARVAGSHPGRPVLGADTTVVLDGEVLGKPRDAAEAASMLRRLSGRSHLVLTGVCLIAPAGGIQTAVAATAVEFLPLDAAQIAAYVATGEPMDKAGAYAIQGGAGRFVRRVDGELANVIGLPISVVADMLRGI